MTGQPLCRYKVHYTLYKLQLYFYITIIQQLYFCTLYKKSISNEDSYFRDHQGTFLVYNSYLAANDTPRFV